ncbi:MAG: NAD(P)H-dependent oxidoreductase [Bacteroidales bacterium]
MNTNDILSAYKFRFACKKFKSGMSIPESDFNTILEAARLSPSSFGFEPTHLVVIQNDEMKERFKPAALNQNQITTCSHLVLFLTRKSIDMTAGSDYLNSFLKEVKKMDDRDINYMMKFFYLFEKENFKLMEDERNMFDWASKQAYILLANMLTTAALLGIDSCPMEGFDPEAMRKLLKDEIHIDMEHFDISVMAAFGYRDMEQPEKTRESIDQLVTWVK